MVLKKQNFKKVVKEKIRKIAFKYLIEIKESQSKLTEIEYREFKTQEYLGCSKLSEEEKSILFKICTRTVEDIKTNFRNKFGSDLACRLCESDYEEESQSHQLTCQSMIRECEELRMNTTYKDFFRNIDDQTAATHLFKKVLDIREKLLKQIGDKSASDA